jgi:hypothetical protein
MNMSIAHAFSRLLLGLPHLVCCYAVQHTIVSSLPLGPPLPDRFTHNFISVVGIESAPRCYQRLHSCRVASRCRQLQGGHPLSHGGCQIGVGSLEELGLVSRTPHHIDRSCSLGQDQACTHRLQPDSPGVKPFESTRSMILVQ